jgi:hypothetical protein
MTIIGFNPSMSVEQFQQVAKTEASSPEQIKTATFVALARNKIEALTACLSADLVEKIQGYAQEREQMVNGCVRQLNALGDCKDDLLVSSESYKTSKKAREVARNAYLTLVGLDSALANKTLETLEGQHAALSKVFAKFKTVFANCCSQSPIAIIENALRALQYGDKDDQQKREKTIEQLRHAIQWWFLDCDLNPSYDLKEHLCKYGSYPDSTMQVLVEQLPIARQKAQEIKAKREAERGERIAQNREILERNISVYQGAKEKCKGEEGYQQYTAKKQAFYKVLQEVGAFCTLSELTSHSKINNQSQSLLYRKTKVATTP